MAWSTYGLTFSSRCCQIISPLKLSIPKIWGKDKINWMTNGNKKFYEIHCKNILMLPINKTTHHHIPEDSIFIVTTMGKWNFTCWVLFTAFKLYIQWVLRFLKWRSRHFCSGLSCHAYKQSNPNISWQHSIIISKGQQVKEFVEDLLTPTDEDIILSWNIIICLCIAIVSNATWTEPLSIFSFLQVIGCR